MMVLKSAICKVLIICFCAVLLTSCQSSRSSETAQSQNTPEAVTDKNDTANRNDESGSAVRQSDTQEGDQNLSEPDADKDNVSDSEHEKAKELNTKGYGLYKQGKYKEALDCFKKSFEADDSYYLPHYNYACTIGVLMKKDYPNWYDRTDEVLAHLKKVRALKPDYIKMIKTDPDLDPIRKEFGYMLLLGLSPKKTADAKQILEQLDWYVQGEGIYSYVGGMEFHKDNTVKLWYYTTDFFKNYDPKLPKYEVTGKYKAEGSNITVTLDEKMLRKKNWQDITDNSEEYEDRTVLKGRLTDKGQIEFDIFDYKISYTYPKFSA